MNIYFLSSVKSYFFPKTEFRCGLHLRILEKIQETSFPKIAIIKYYKLGNLKQEKFIFPHFWRLSEVTVSAEPCTFWRFQGRILPCSFPSFLAPSNLWHSLTCICITPTFASFMWHARTCVFPLARLQSLDLGSALNQYDLILTK